MSCIRRCLMSPPLVLLSTLLPACASPAEPGPPEPPAAGAKPAATLPELQNRLIHYADSLKQPKDPAQHVFTSMLGVTLTPIAPGAKSGRVKDMPLSGGYMFYASSLATQPPHTFGDYEVGIYRHGGPAFTEDERSPCVWDAAVARQRLESIGYQAGGERPFQRGRRQEFWRPIEDSEKEFYVHLLTYTTVAGQEKTCVYAIRFSGGNP